jgi:hypothetical protein
MNLSQKFAEANDQFNTLKNVFTTGDAQEAEQPFEKPFHS